MKTLKNSTIAALFCAAAITSCSKQLSNSDISLTDNGEKIPVTFSLAGAVADVSITKSTGSGASAESAGTTDEKTVSMLNIFVFNQDGTLVEAASKSGSADNKSLTMNLTSGSGFDIYAVVNPDSDMSGTISSRQDLVKELSTKLDSDNGNAYFGMSGKLENVSVSSTSNSFEIAVSRRAAKIAIQKITNNLNPAAGKITIEGIYLANVVTDAYFFEEDATKTAGGTYIGNNWINQKGVYSSLSSRAWFADKLGTPAEVANSAAYETAHYFYACPNPTATDVNGGTGAFTARFTRLVIKTIIQGNTYYYPISLDGKSGSVPMATANKFINIKEVKINHLGSSDPDTPVSTEDVSLSVSVNDWSLEELDQYVI